MDLKNEELIKRLADSGYNYLVQQETTITNPKVTDVYIKPDSLLSQLNNIVQSLEDRYSNLEDDIYDETSYIDEIREINDYDEDLDDDELDDEAINLALDRINKKERQQEKINNSVELLRKLITRKGKLSVSHSEKNKMDMPLSTTLIVENGKVKFRYVNMKFLIYSLFRHRFGFQSAFHSFSLVLALHYYVDGIKVDNKILKEIDDLVGEYSNRIEKDFDVTHSLYSEILEESMYNTLRSANKNIPDIKYNYEKVGKHLKKLFPDADNTAIETLSTELNRYFNINHEEYEKYFDIVSGEDITYYYNSYNNTYFDAFLERNDNRSKGGSLKNSCMRNISNNKNISTYAKNPDKVNMLILKDKDGNGILGRAILWLANGNIYVDRLYTISSSIENLFINYITKRGFIGIHPSSDNGKKSGGFVISLRLGRDTPYIDTLTKRGMISTYNNKSYMILSFGSNRSRVINFIADNIGVNNIKYVTNEFLLEELRSDKIELVLPNIILNLNNSGYNIDGRKLLRETSRRLNEIEPSFTRLHKLFKNKSQNEKRSIIGFDLDKTEEFNQMYPELAESILFSNDHIVERDKKKKKVYISIRKGDLDKYFNEDDIYEQDSFLINGLYFIKQLTEKYKGQDDKEENKKGEPYFNPNELHSWDVATTGSITRTELLDAA